MFFLKENFLKSTLPYRLGLESRMNNAISLVAETFNLDLDHLKLDLLIAIKHARMIAEED